MGYHLPGISLLGPGKLDTHPIPHKKVKDPRSQRSPSSVTASSSSPPPVPAVAPAKDKAFWQKWKQELRPLLNSIRFVESNNLRYGDACCAAIGPFQISRRYHHDAWKHAPTFASAASWTRCRDVSHAENTVIAYWLKHCPEAVERRDFEVLTRIHNGGPQGLQREKTEYYWKQVSKHLREQEMAKMKENMLSKQSPLRKHSKQDDSKKASPSPLSPIVSNTIAARKAQSQKHECDRPSWTNVPKRFIGNIKPKVLDTQQEGESKCSIKQRTPFKMDQEVRKSAHKRCNNAKYSLSKAKFERVHLRNALTEDHRREKAALKIQTFWRMLYVRRWYRRLRAATLSLQRAWRRHYYILPNTENNCYYKFQQDERNAEVSLETEECMQSIKSPCELLYSTDISPKQEDALLTELVRLLKLDTGDATREPCHSFQFPRSEEDDENEVSTPKMKTEVNWCFESASPSNFPVVCSNINDTPLAIKEALPSPFTETSVVDELAKLFPCRLQLTVHEDTADEKSVSSVHGDKRDDDEGIRRCEDSLGKMKGMSNEYGAHTEFGDCPRRQNHSFETYSLTSSRAWNVESKHTNNIKESSCHGYELRHDREEEELNIPLLQDQSPVVKSKTCRRRNQNPCTRKVEWALISSLSEWQSSRSFKEKQGYTSSSRINDPSVENQEFCVSSTLYKCRPLEAQVSKFICESNESVDNSHLDYLLETSVQDSTVYAKAVFQCMSISIEELKLGVGEEPGQYEMRLAETTEGSGQQNCATTLLRHLCMLWEKNNVDLLTRSSKYKSLVTIDSDDDFSKLSYVQSEIQLQEKCEFSNNLSEGRDLALHQRNTIYSNIVAFCDGEERQRLYNRWGIEEPSSDCLEKIVYDLLWNDPRRYEESAELVFKYL